MSSPDKDTLKTEVISTLSKVDATIQAIETKVWLNLPHQFLFQNCVRSTQVPCKYPDQRLRNTGTLKVPWPAFEVHRYPAQCLRYTGTLQVPLPVLGVYKCPNQWQGCAGTLTSIRGVQVPWPVSWVRRYPDQYQCVQVPLSYPTIPTLDRL